MSSCSRTWGGCDERRWCVSVRDRVQGYGAEEQLLKSRLWEEREQLNNRNCWEGV